MSIFQRERGIKPGSYLESGVIPLGRVDEVPGESEGEGVERLIFGDNLWRGFSEAVKDERGYFTTTEPVRVGRTTYKVTAELERGEIASDLRYEDVEKLARDQEKRHQEYCREHGTPNIPGF